MGGIGGAGVGGATESGSGGAFVHGHQHTRCVVCPNERTNVDDSLSNPSLFHCVLQRWRDCRLVGMSSPAPVPLVGRTKAAEGG